MLARLIFGGDRRNREGGESGGINDSFALRSTLAASRPTSETMPRAASQAVASRDLGKPPAKC